MLIIQILNNIFKLFYCDTIISTYNVLKIDNEIYSIDILSKENNGFVGFFDWLRLKDSKIVGIRTCYFEDLPYNKILSTYKYIGTTYNGKCFEFLFTGENYVAELSGDQDFTNNFVYISDTNNYLLTFGLDHLEKEELEDIIILCTRLKVNELINDL